MYRIQITEITTDDMNGGIPRLTMVVDHIDLNAIIAAANRKPRKPRSDKGRTRQDQPELA